MKTQPRDSLRRFFAGMAEHTFQAQLGVADPPLIDYISDLLTRFVRSDAVYRVRGLTGRPLTEVATMMMEAQERVGEARREVHRHIGDFTLFWAGVYPEALPKMRGPSKSDHLIDYCAQGKRAYWIASTIESPGETTAPSALLVRLSSQFEMCAYGLREVRRLWEHRDPDDDLPRPLVLWC
jgi:hypothetical protein